MLPRLPPPSSLRRPLRRRPRRPAIALATLCAGLVLGLAPRAARAEATVLAAPVGGQAIAVGGRRVVCPGDQELSGWQVEAGGHKLRPPAKGGAARALVHVAASLEACANQNEPLVAQAVVAWPEVAAESLSVNVDTGRVDAQGVRLKDVALNWHVGERSGVDVCRDVDLRSDGKEHCAFAVPRDLPADAGSITFTFLPEGVPPGDDTAAFDARGRKLNLGLWSASPAKVMMQELFVADATLDAESDESRVRWRHPEAVGQVSCLDAGCELAGSELLVRGLRGSDDSLEVRVALRPHVFLQQGGATLATPLVSLPLQRCPLALASSAPLRAVGGQRVVLRVGGRCAEDGNLRYTVGGAPAAVLDHVHAEDGHFVVVQAEGGLAEDVAIAVQRRSRVVALLRVKTRQVPTVHARIELAGHGEVDFLPTNRDAEVLLPPLGDGAVLVPVAVPGVYTVSHDGGKNSRVRGLAGTTGWVALRYAYRDGSLPGALGQLDLAHVADTVDRSIHEASLPISLGASVLSREPLIELLCHDGDDANRRMSPASTHNLDWRNKDSCRLVLHRERLRPEDGVQLVRINVSVAGMDGTNRPEAAVDQRIMFRPGAQPRYLYIGGVGAPFDRVVVRATVVTEDLRGSVNNEGEGEHLVMPQVQWSLILGNSRLRLYATMSMPSGLFRVAEANHSGIVNLSAGIIGRLVLLSSQGVQAPIGLEVGTLVLGIVGDSTTVPRGVFAFVGGLSLGVPIANVSKTTQAAISLHIWAEYEITRRYARKGGRPWGFIFGPSISFGDVGLNL